MLLLLKRNGIIVHHAPAPADASIVVDRAGIVIPEVVNVGFVWGPVNVPAVMVKVDGKYDNIKSE